MRYRFTFFCILLSSLVSQAAQAGVVDSLLARMTLREKVSQIVIANINTPGISHLKLGGVILEGGDLAANIRLMNELQEASEIPVLVSIDGEWGASMRFREFTMFPRTMQLGALRSAAPVYEAGLAIGTELRALNVLLDYAPDVDVNNNPSNPVIGVRSFGEDRDKVAEFGAAYARGLNDAGVAATAKHFPGHGDTDVDSHKGLPVLNFDRRRLDSLELYPFRKLISEGVDLVMVGHLSIPALDSTMTPASISRPIITELLKKELGYKGLVITDALDMKGVAGDGADASIEAYKAGADILLMPLDAGKTIDTLERAFLSGTLDERELDARVSAFLSLKERLGMLDAGFSGSIDTSLTEGALHNPQKENLIQEIADKSMTVVKKRGRLPHLKRLDEVAYVAYHPSENSPFITGPLERRGARVFTISEGADDATVKGVVDQIAGRFGKVIVGFHCGTPAMTSAGPRRMTKPSAEQFRMLAELGKRSDAVCFYFGIPYDFNRLPGYDGFDCIVVGYEDTEYNNRAAAKLVLGEITAQGELPVQAGKYSCGHRAK